MLCYAGNLVLFYVKSNLHITVYYCAIKNRTVQTKKLSKSDSHTRANCTDYELISLGRFKNNFSLLTTLNDFLVFIFCRSHCRCCSRSSCCWFCCCCFILNGIINVNETIKICLMVYENKKRNLTLYVCAISVTSVCMFGLERFNFTLILLAFFWC